MSLNTFVINMENIMKSFVYLLLISILIISIFSGCELKTNSPNKSERPGGKDMIISEIFTIPPHQYYAYSWVEIYNPSLRTLNWFEQSYPAISAVVGEEGTILYTDNDGITWQNVPSGTNVNLNSVGYPLTDTGYAVGDNGTIIKLTRLSDGRMSASDYSFANPDTARKDLNDIMFLPIPNKAGYIVGDSGTILYTTDRGNRWSFYSNNRIPYNLHSVYYRSGLAYTVGDSGILLRSTRARVWEPKSPPDQFLKANFYGVTFINDTGWVVGEKGAILFSKSKGEIWTAQDPPNNINSTFRDVFFKDEAGYNRLWGWVVGDNGVILKTTNWGATWEQKESNTNVNLYNVNFADSLRGFVFGENGTILRTFDGGESWFPMSNSGTASHLYGSHLNPPNVFVSERYVLEILAKRKEFFYDPTTGTINYSVFVKIDSGYVLFDPALLLQFGIETKPIVPGGFTIINSDSIKFTNHTKLGPGQVNVINANIGYYYDTTATRTFGVRPVLWDLLSTGEIRLVKYSEKFDRFNFRFLNFDKKIIDVVRWGNFVAPDSATYAKQYFQIWPQGGYYVLQPYKWSEPRYDNNVSAGFIPEWYSLARYANDVGKFDESGNPKPELLNTSTSFYITKDPIPGWYSQRSK